MSADAGALERAVSAVEEPELRLPLGEAGLVREVRSRWGRTTVSIGLVHPDHPQLGELRRRVEAALAGAGARDAQVDLVPLGEEEAGALASRLRERLAAPVGAGPDGAPVAPLGHEQGRGNPFTRPGSRTRVLGISSGKGGVGKSSVTVNLAVALAAKGASVAVLDADVYGFSVPRMLGLNRAPLVVGDLLIPPVAHGVACISMGFFVDDDTPVIWRGPMLHKALEQFLADTWWGEPDFLVIDMPPGTGDVALSMAQYLPRSEVYVVTTPQAAAQRVAARSALAARKLKLPVRGVVENMSYFRGDDGRRYELFGRGGGAALAAQLGVPLLGTMPLLPAVGEGGDAGVPVGASDPAGEAAQAFAALADAISSLGPARVYRSELRLS